MVAFIRAVRVEACTVTLGCRARHGLLHWRGKAEVVLPQASLPQTQSSSSTAVVKINQRRWPEGSNVATLLELAGNSGARRLHVDPPGTREGKAEASRSWRSASSVALLAFVRKVFLPTEYPHSVSANYLGFVRAMSLQMLFSHISRVLATQAMLLAVGVGSQSALPLAAVTAWVLKDGLGHMVAIAFGTVVNTRFDSDPKRFRFQAALLGKVADLLSIFTLGRPEYFLALSTLGSAFGRVSASTAQSCRAKIYETFARQENLGDVLRCSQAQTVAAQLLGTGIGALLGPIVGSDVHRLLLGNAAFSCAAIYCAYTSSALVQMRTLNVQRAEILFHRVLSDLLPAASGRKSVDILEAPRLPEYDGMGPTVLSLQQVQEMEVFVQPYSSLFPGAPLLVNPPLCSSHVMLTPSTLLHAARYVIGLDWASDESGRPRAILIWYTSGAAAKEVIRGFFHACVFRRLLSGALQQHGNEAPGSAGAVHQAHLELDTVMRIFEHSDVLQELWWHRVASALSDAEWRMDVAFLDAKELRISVEASGGQDS